MNSLLAYIEGLESRINQLERRLNNVMREGVVSEVDYAKGMAVMKAGDIETPMTSWLTRAGDIRDWNPVTKGERAILLSPTGDPAQGFILPGGFSKNFPQNHNGGAQPRRSIGDYSFTESAQGGVWRAGAATMTFSSDGLLIEQGGQTYKLGGGGFYQTGGEQKHDGKNVGSSHVHSGVVKGGADTEGPH